MSSERISSHYDQNYFDSQTPIEMFGGWANSTKFSPYISKEDVVLDFGCGGGILLTHLKCKERLGVEVNPAAIETARQNGIQLYSSAEEVTDLSVDTIISNHALEHTLRPLDELKILYSKLKIGGKIILVVPCESYKSRYKPNDRNHHIYSWSPMCLGNLLTEAGYSLIESTPYIHKWPPKCLGIARFGGRALFDLACRIYGRIDTSLTQVRAIAEKLD